MARPAPTAPAESEPDPDAARTARHLATLDRLEAVGMNLVGRIERVSAGEASEAEAALFAGQDIVLAFTRVARAVRQIIVLAQETMGLRPPPGSRGLTQAGAGRNGSGSSAHSGRYDPRDSDDYRYDCSDEERAEQQRLDREMSKRIYEALAQIRDAMPGPDDDKPRSPKDAIEFDWEIFGIKNPDFPPSGRGPP